LGVLDIGSNAANLRVVDAYPGSPPLPVYRLKTPTRLAEEIRADGAVGVAGVKRLVAAVCSAVDAARGYNVAELIPFATSAVRDAANRDQILAADPQSSAGPSGRRPPGHAVAAACARGARPGGAAGEPGGPPSKVVATSKT
jgi:hypothetical protein